MEWTLEQRKAYHCIPPIVYKYVVPDRVDILQSGMIKCSHPEEFTDFFDSYHALEVDSAFNLNTCGSPFFILEIDPATGLPREGHRELVRSFLKSSTSKYNGYFFDSVIMTPEFGTVENAKAFKEGLFAQFHERMGTTRVLCLSEDPTNSVMWDYYSSGHRGFCIGFRTDTSLFKNQATGGSFLKKMLYESEPSKGPREVAMWRKWLVKNVQYQHEREIRASFQKDILYSKIVSGQNMYFRMLNFSDIDSITFGVKCSKELTEKIISILPGQVKFYRAVQTPSAYKLQLADM